MCIHRQPVTSPDTSEATNALEMYGCLMGMIVLASMAYVAWFLVELVRQGEGSDERLHVKARLPFHAVAFVAGVTSLFLLPSVLSVLRGLRSADGNNKRGGKCCCTDMLQFLVPILCLAASAGYFLFYVPLGLLMLGNYDSEFTLWLCRWVPWLALGLVGFAPFCCARECILSQYDQDVPTSVEAGVYEGGEVDGGRLGHRDVPVPPGSSSQVRSQAMESQNTSKKTQLCNA